MKKVSTKQLLNRLKKNKGKFFEVALSNGIFRATHILYWRGKMLYDTGIDSQDIKWTREDFINWYPKAYWLIDQVVS